MASAHIGLLGVLLVYIVFGAVVFYAIEQPYEVQIRSDGIASIAAKKEEILDKIQQKLDTKFITKDEFFKFANEEVDEYIRELFHQFGDNYMSAEIEAGEHSDSSKEMTWTFGSSLFFCATTLLTIGMSKNFFTTFYF